MKDFYGKELEEGDKILFATGSGSSGARIREGIFLKGHASGYVTVRPTLSLSGKITRKMYLDERTGKWADPWNHVEAESHYAHKDTGARITPDQYSKHKDGGWSSELNPDYVPDSMRKHVPAVYKSYLREIELPGGWAVVLQDTRNIVKLG